MVPGEELQQPVDYGQNKEEHLRPAPSAMQILCVGSQDAARERHSGYVEDRNLLLGMVQNRLLAVAYTLRDSRVRIVSARMAEPRERRRYHEQNS